MPLVQLYFREKEQERRFSGAPKEASHTNSRSSFTPCFRWFHTPSGYWSRGADCWRELNHFRQVLRQVLTGYQSNRYLVYDFMWPVNNFRSVFSHFGDITGFVRRQPLFTAPQHIRARYCNVEVSWSDCIVWIVLYRGFARSRCYCTPLVPYLMHSCSV